MLIVQIILLLHVLTLLLPGGLNYKLLMNGEDPLSILIPVLTSTNVHMVSKLANKVPCTVVIRVLNNVVMCEILMDYIQIHNYLYIPLHWTSEVADQL